MLKFALYLILFFIGISLVRSVIGLIMRGFAEGLAEAGPQRPREVVSPGGELKRDPVCGTYVSATTVHTKSLKGQVQYFCSKECRDKFRG